MLYTDADDNTAILPPNSYLITLNTPATGQQWGIGGTLTYPRTGDAIANGTTLTIIRAIPDLQTTSLSNQGTLWQSVVEQALDTLCMQIQQVATRTGQWRGTWQTNTQYNYGDISQDGANGANTGNYYFCAGTNLSGVWATDLANGYWVVYLNIQQVAGYAMDAAASAVAAALSASTATSEAATATAAATNALTSSGTASAAATTATTQAGIATTQAAGAAASASTASTSATTATTQAGIATSAAITATTQAGIATTEAGIAAAAALSAASNLTATSTTSNTIGTGNFTFATQANKNFYPGQFIVAASNANGANYIHGQVQSYGGTTLVITESDNGGSGAHADWNISASGPQGASGSGAGTVITMSVAMANGFSGTVANPTTTPTITLAATPTGILKSNGTAISAATAGTDYVAPGGNAGTPSAIVLTNASGTAINLNIGGNAATATSATSATTAGTCSGNSATATKLSTARTIAITGDLTYNSGNFDGSANVTAAGTLATVNSNVGSFTNATLTVNGKGLVTAASSGTSSTPVAVNSAVGLQITNNSGTPTTKADIVCAQAVLLNSSNVPVYVSGVTVTIDMTTTGANALDAGSIGANTEYHLYIINNGTTTAGLASLSPTSPTMPGGYTYSMRVGSMLTGPSATFLRTLQYGNVTKYQVITSSTTPNLPIISSGVVGGVGAPTYVAETARGTTGTGNAKFTPSTARRFLGVYACGSSAGAEVIIAPNGNYGPVNQSTNPPPIWAVTNQNVTFDFLLESSAIYWASNASTSTINCAGWVDSVNAS